MYILEVLVAMLCRARHKSWYTLFEGFLNCSNADSGGKTVEAWQLMKIAVVLLLSWSPAVCCFLHFLVPCVASPAYACILLRLGYTQLICKCAVREESHLILRCPFCGDLTMPQWGKIYTYALLNNLQHQ